MQRKLIKRQVFILQVVTGTPVLKQHKMSMPDTSSTPDSPCGTLTEQLPQHILPSTKPSEQMLLQQDTFPTRQKSSCSLLCPTHLHWPLGPSPPHKAAALLQAQARAWMHRGVTGSTGWPTCHGWNPGGRDETIIHCKGCYGRGFAPAWQCRCPACPRGASSGSSDWAHQWRSWLQVALGSFLCNVQESVIHPLKYLVTANHNTALMMENASSFHEMGVHCQANKKPLMYINGESFSYQKHFASFCHHCKSKDSDFLSWAE